MSPNPAVLTWPRHIEEVADDFIMGFAGEFTTGVSWGTPSPITVPINVGPALDRKLIVVGFDTPNTNAATNPAIFVGGQSINNWVAAEGTTYGTYQGVYGWVTVGGEVDFTLTFTGDGYYMFSIWYANSLVVPESFAVTASGSFAGRTIQVGASAGGECIASTRNRVNQSADYTWTGADVVDGGVAGDSVGWQSSARLSPVLSDGLQAVSFVMDTSKQGNHLIAMSVREPRNPDVLFIDYFNRSTGSNVNISTPWIGIGLGMPQIMAIQNHLGTSAGSTVNGVIVNRPFSSDQWAEARYLDYSQAGTGKRMYLYVRTSGNPASGYRAYFFGEPPWAWGIERIDSLTATELASGNWSPVGGGADIFRLEAEGTTIRAYHNGVLLGDAEDATYSSGSPGVGTYRPASKVDDFEAGEL